MCDDDVHDDTMYHVETTVKSSVDIDVNEHTVGNTSSSGLPHTKHN